MSSLPQNPYEPPQEPTLASFRDSSSSISVLEKRIADLEMQLSKSWFTRPNIFYRICAVWGHFILGYGIVLLLVMPFAFLFFLIDYYLYGMR